MTFWPALESQVALEGGSASIVIPSDAFFAENGAPALYFLPFLHYNGSRQHGEGEGGIAMRGMPDERLAYEILSAVGEIPEGRVASYGQIARLIGRERNARLVGRVLSLAEFYGRFPCHRVVNSAGRMAPHFPEQRRRLEAEGVGFRPNGCVDMRRFQWDC